MTGRLDLVDERPVRPDLANVVAGAGLCAAAVGIILLEEDG